MTEKYLEKEDPVTWLNDLSKSLMEKEIEKMDIEYDNLAREAGLPDLVDEEKTKEAIYMGMDKLGFRLPEGRIKVRLTLSEGVGVEGAQRENLILLCALALNKHKNMDSILESLKVQNEAYRANIDDMFFKMYENYIRAINEIFGSYTTPPYQTILRHEEVFELYDSGKLNPENLSKLVKSKIPQTSEEFRQYMLSWEEEHIRKEAISRIENYNEMKELVKKYGFKEPEDYHPRELSEDEINKEMQKIREELEKYKKMDGKELEKEFEKFKCCLEEELTLLTTHLCEIAKEVMPFLKTKKSLIEKIRKNIERIDYKRVENAGMHETIHYIHKNGKIGRKYCECYEKLRKLELYTQEDNREAINEFLDAFAEYYPYTEGIACLASSIWERGGLNKVRKNREKLGIINATLSWMKEDYLRDWKNELERNLNINDRRMPKECLEEIIKQYGLNSIEEYLNKLQENAKRVVNAMADIFLYGEPSHIRRAMEVGSIEDLETLARASLNRR